MTRVSLQEIIQQACEVLHQGGLLLYPADTVWGIGCDATRPESIRRMLMLKGQPGGKGLIVLTASISQLYEVVGDLHPRIDTLLRHHERPLTIIYPGARPAYRHAAAADGSIAVRVVRAGFCRDLLVTYGLPLISTSANLAGMPAPTTFGTISSALLQAVDMVVPAIAEKGITGIPSVIARYDPNGELDFLRTGVNSES